MKRLPVLQIHQWRSQPDVFAENLRQAAHRVGFFLVQHDIQEDVIHRLVRETRQFFKQPIGEKMRLSYEDSPAFRGYMAMGNENTSGKVDYREQVELASENLNRDVSSGDSKFYERLRGTNPIEGTLRQAVEDYIESMTGLSMELTEALGLALGLERNSLKHLFQRECTELDPFWQLKLASVQSPPPSSQIGHEEEMFGVGPHTDSGFLTLLLQDTIGGLQVYFDDDWHDIPPPSLDTFVCNIGECAELASYGYFRATPHRVKVVGGERISIPFFWNPHLSSIIKPLEVGGLRWERPNTDHWKRPNNAFLECYGANAFKSLARSHPHVFRRHHPDLCLSSDGRISSVVGGRN